MSKDRKGRHWISLELEYGVFLLAVWLLRAVSLKTAFKLAKLGARILYMIDFKHRERVIQHMLHSGIVKTRAEAEPLAKANFLHCLKVFIEIVKIDQCIGPDNFREKLSLKISDPAAKRILDGEPRQAIVVTGHLGNWELAGTAYCWQGNVRMTSIMRPLNNKKIGDYVYRHRTNARHRTVSREKGIRPLLQAIKEGDTVAIVADQHASTTEGVETVFFGHPVRTHSSPALLHLKTGLPLWPCFLVRQDDDFHFAFESDGLLEVEPTGDKKADTLRITQMLNDAVEKFVRRHPEQWLWAHRRWLDINRKHSSLARRECNEQAPRERAGA